MFFRKTVDSIIADITQKVAALQALSEKHNSAAAAHGQAATASIKLQSDAIQEAYRAKSIAAKLASLVS